MKKIVSMIMVLGLMVFMSVTASAHSIDNKMVGIGLNLSWDWINTRDDSIIIFHYKTNQNEQIEISSVNNEWAWGMDFVNQDSLKTLCDNRYSDENIVKNLKASNNNAAVSIKVHSVTTKSETYNGVAYLRYDKSYTASAPGFVDERFYQSVFITAKNGKLYFIEYQRDSKTSHNTDFVNMMNSISYKNSEIKIKINNEIIYPDSAPMIIENRTLVPIRAVAEKMGYTVAWDGERQLVTLTASKGIPVLHFAIGNNIALKNLSEDIPLDVPPVIIGARTYLPLRAVAEAMEASVNWNGAERTVEITY